MWHKAGKSTYDAYAGLGRILARSFSFDKLLDVRLSSKGPTCGGYSYYPENARTSGPRFGSDGWCFLGTEKGCHCDSDEDLQQSPHQHPALIGGTQNRGPLCSITSLVATMVYQIRPPVTPSGGGTDSPTWRTHKIPEIYYFGPPWHTAALFRLGGVEHARGRSSGDWEC